MTKITGLFDWVRHNNARSVALLFGFLLLMQPLAIIALFLPLLYADPAHAPIYHWAGYASRYVPLVTLSAAALFALQMWWHVKAVRRDVAFRFVDSADEPRLCALIEPLAITAGISIPYVGVIDSPAANAFACGIRRNFSVLVFTRGIIDGLDDDELSAVIAHELIHIRNGDTRLIAAANIFMRNLASLERLGGWKPRRYRQIAALLILPVLFPLYLGVALLSQLCLRLGLASRLLISASREFIADAEAVRLTQNPSALLSALQRIHTNSAIAGLPPEQDAMMIAGLSHGRLATHPPIMERIQAIVALTGQMALDARPRRDTRDAARLRPFASTGGLLAENHDALERVAARIAVPRSGGFHAYRRVGGDQNILGLRWDLALAMLATFCTAMILHRGNIGGVLGQMGHVLAVPGTNAAWLINNAQGCTRSELRALLNTSTAGDGCGLTPAFAAHAKLAGINVLPDGRLLSDTQMAMLSPDELRGPAGLHDLPGGGFATLAPKPPVRPIGPVTDLAPSYPLPLHAAWQRLANGDIAPYLRARQCGILVHAHVSTVPDQSVTWSITSESVEQIRFTATLAPDGPAATHVALAIADFEKTIPVSDAGKPDRPYPVAMRPALKPPLRPVFAEAISAMLQGRMFRIDNITAPTALDPGTKTTAEICGSEWSRLAAGSHLSIHDPDGQL